MKICICDDSLDIHTNIKKKLHNKLWSTDPFEITDLFSGEDLIDFYKNQKKFDIIFLDIEMNNINGIDTACKIRKYDSKAIIIFISNHTQYILDAFRAEALHFIVKPIKDYEFEDVFTRAINKYNLTHSFMALTWHSDRHTVLVDDIIYVEGYHRHLTFHTKEGVFDSLGKINDILSTLEPHGFIKIHQGFIVNLSCIRHITKSDVILCDNSKVMMSVRKRSDTIRAYDKYINTMRW